MKMGGGRNENNKMYLVTVLLKLGSINYCQGISPDPKTINNFPWALFLTVGPSIKNMGGQYMERWWFNKKKPSQVSWFVLNLSALLNFKYSKFSLCTQVEYSFDFSDSYCRYINFRTLSPQTRTQNDYIFAWLGAKTPNLPVIQYIFLPFSFACVFWLGIVWCVVLTGTVLYQMMAVEAH